MTKPGAGDEPQDPAAESIRRLRALDACAVSDALDKRQLPGVVVGLPRRSGEGVVAGRVITVKLETAGGRTAPRHLCTAAIEAAGPLDVIVVEQRSGVDAAGWGGILSLAAKVRGVPGVIVEGPARDIDESERHGFSVFARSLTSHTARGRIIEVAWNVPIVVGDVTVPPGAYVIADGSAVVFVNADDLPVILDAAEAIATREGAMARAVQAGTPVSEVMGADYERMLQKPPSAGNGNVP
jgi:regulator of RNase E activity RraA